MNFLIKMFVLSVSMFLSSAAIPTQAEPFATAEYNIYLPLLSQPYPVEPASGLRIAYSSHWTGELMQYDVDLGAVTQLLPAHFMSTDCWKFSPDIGNPKLLFLLANPTTNDLDLKMKDFASNSDTTFPTAYRNHCSFYWHPSGEAIAVYNFDKGTYDLLFPTSLKLASFWGELGWKAAFSPDGNRVVFVTSNRSNTLIFFDIVKDINDNIVGINQSPSDFVEVEIGDHFIADVEWSSDGSKLAIIIENNWNLEDADILLIQPDGIVLTNLTNGFNRLDGKLQNYQDMSWSPTQEKIAIWVYNLVDNSYVNPQTYVIDLPSRRITELTGGEYDMGETPSFSPDGNKIIFTAGPYFGHTIVMSNPDGSGKTPLPIENSAFDATFRP